MLAVERRHDLARVEIGKGHDVQFGEAKKVFGSGNHACYDGIIYRTA